VKIKNIKFLDPAPEEGGGDPKEKEQKEIKTSADLLKELGEIKSGLEKKAKEDAKAEVTEQLKAISESIEAVKAMKPEVTAEELKQVKSDLDVTIKAFDKLQIILKDRKGVQQKSETKTFNESLIEAIEANADKIKNFKHGNPEQKFELKAVGDMSIATNFPTAGSFNVDVRNQLIQRPFERTWLGDILPGGTSNGSSILYPKENGGEGGAALWTDSTQDKAQMDFDLTGQSAYFKWIAGFVIVERDMLDDIAFLQSYLAAKMLISLKIAENSFILNGSSDTNPVSGFLDVATAYDGTYTNRVDRVIDAAWGQLVEDTFDFYNPTDVILTPRDSVKIGLNKSGGSDEYDLPAGSVAFAQGQLGLAGLQTVKTTDIGSGNFLAFDRNATMFVKRLQPELRMFEDATLAKKNKIMFRVEERATLAIFNNAALVKGTLDGSAS
jgi:HK97 family phage major capsid protein